MAGTGEESRRGDEKYRGRLSLCHRGTPLLPRRGPPPLYHYAFAISEIKMHLVSHNIVDEVTVEGGKTLRVGALRCWLIADFAFSQDPRRLYESSNSSRPRCHNRSSNHSEFALVILGGRCA
ncbi:unnamed protein product [Fusarium graminearum]|nr:unnamed protein product [Fusarium graminearum]